MTANPKFPNDETLRRLFLEARYSDFLLYLDEKVIPAVDAPTAQTLKEQIDHFCVRFVRKILTEKVPPTLKDLHLDVFNELFRLLYPQLKNSKACARLKSEFKSPDWFEDAFIWALSDLSTNIQKRTFENKSALETYFYIILRNKCLKMLKTMRNNLPLPDLPDPVLGTSQNDASKNLTRQNLQDFLGILHKYLGNDCIDRLYMFHVEGYSHGEISDMMPDHNTPARILAHICRQSIQHFMNKNRHLITEYNLEFLLKLMPPDTPEE